MKSSQGMTDKLVKQFVYAGYVTKIACPLAALGSMLISYKSFYPRFGSIDIFLGMNAAMIWAFLLGAGLSLAFYGFVLSSINLMNWDRLKHGSSKSITVLLCVLCGIMMVLSCTISFSQSVFVGMESRDTAESMRVRSNMAYKNAKKRVVDAEKALVGFRSKSEIIDSQIKSLQDVASQYLASKNPYNAAVNSRKSLKLFESLEINSIKIDRALNILSRANKSLSLVADSLRSKNEGAKTTADIFIGFYIEYLSFFLFSLAAIFAAFYKGSVFTYEVDTMPSGNSLKINGKVRGFNLSDLKNSISSESNSKTVDLKDPEFYNDHMTFRSGDIVAARAWLQWMVYNKFDCVTRLGGDTSYVKHRLKIPNNNKQTYNRARMAAVRFMEGNPSQDAIDKRIEDCEMVEGMQSRAENIDHIYDRLRTFHTYKSGGKFTGKEL